MGRPMPGRGREKESFGMEAKKSNRIEDALSPCLPPGSNSHLEMEKRATAEERERAREEG